MLVFFPTPYPDEILYSLCARFSDRVHYSSYNYVLLELFGTTTVDVSGLKLTSFLDHLVASLPPGNRLSVKRFIDAHTLLPIYRPFLSPDQISFFYPDKDKSIRRKSYRQMGVKANYILTSERFRFCPICVKEDKECFGESYWHRLHQVSGVEVCPIHSVFLEESFVYTRNFSRNKPFDLIPADKAWLTNEPRPLDLTNLTCQIMLEIARGAAWLLKESNLFLNLRLLRSRYCELLKENECLNLDGSIDRNKLIKKIENKYSRDPIVNLSPTLNLFPKEWTWTIHLLRSLKAKYHPLEHLLLISFLGHTPKTFFQFCEDYKPFGSGPWPCLNPICQHYQQKQIEGCYIDQIKGSGKVTGTFHCYCGFIYSCTGSDSSEEARLKEIRAFGPLWEKALRELWANPKISLREIAKRLGVSTHSINLHAELLKLPPRRIACSLLQNISI